MCHTETLWGPRQGPERVQTVLGKVTSWPQPVLFVAVFALRRSLLPFSEFGAWMSDVKSKSPLNSHPLACLIVIMHLDYPWFIYPDHPHFHARHN